jgi:hypothetical protein
MMMPAYLSRDATSLENARRMAEDGAIYTQECSQALNATERFIQALPQRMKDETSRWHGARIVLVITTVLSVFHAYMNPSASTIAIASGVCCVAYLIFDEMKTNYELYAMAKLKKERAELDKRSARPMSQVDDIYTSIISVFGTIFCNRSHPENGLKYNQVHTYAVAILARLPVQDSDEAHGWSKQTPALRAVCQRISDVGPITP